MTVIETIRELYVEAETPEQALRLVNAPSGSRAVFNRVGRYRQKTVWQIVEQKG